jgi:hypothetical protein
MGAGRAGKHTENGQQNVDAEISAAASDEEDSHGREKDRDDDEED